MNGTEVVVGYELTCRYDCSVNTRDAVVATELEKDANTVAARLVRSEIEQRTARCAGPVVCGHQVECGLIHGNLQVSES